MKDNWTQAGTKKFQRVEIEWDDARVKGGWRAVGEYQGLSLAPCVAIGYRIQQRDRKVVVLVQQLGMTDHVSDAVVIPRNCIRRIKRLSTRHRI